MKKDLKFCGNKEKVSYTQHPNNINLSTGPRQVEENKFNNVDYLNIRYDDKSHRQRIKKCYDSILLLSVANGLSLMKPASSMDIVRRFAARKYNVCFVKRDLLIEQSWKSLEKKIEKFVIKGVGIWGSMEAGYIFAPYIPLITTPTAIDAEILKVEQGILKNYLSQPVDTNYYGHIVVGTQPVVEGSKIRNDKVLNEDGYRIKKSADLNLFL